ncbi:iron ABC transporter permease [Escherichia coli]|nr:iron ABC transporter permease [Escherichia coli]
MGLGVALLIAPRLNVLALGDKVALGLGVNLVQTRLLGLLAIALLCGAAVAVAGPIGFIRLVVPHVVRRLVTEDIHFGAAARSAGGGAGAGAGGHLRPDAGRAAGSWPPER